MELLIALTILAVIQYVLCGPVTVPFQKRPLETTLLNDRTNQLYLVNITVGIPPQALLMQFDTGSETSWVIWGGSNVCIELAACFNGSFDPSKSSTYDDFAPGLFEVDYLGGDRILGDWVQDSLTIAGITLLNMKIGLGKTYNFPPGAAPEDTENPFPFGGILGVGLLSNHTDWFVQNGDAVTIPSLLELMVQQGIISSRAFSIYLDAANTSTGTVVFGGVDTAKYNGDLVTVPIVPENGGDYGWVVLLDSVKFDGRNGTVDCSASHLNASATIDTGTASTYVPWNIAVEILKIVGAINTTDYGYIVPCNVADWNASISFGLQNSSAPTIDVPISQFVDPALQINTTVPLEMNGTRMCYWGLVPAGVDPQSGFEIPVLLGDTFLRGAYVLFDVDGLEMGFAMARFDADGSNLVNVPDLK